MSHICPDPTKTIEIEKATTFTRVINIKRNGNALDITGATITIGVKKKPEDTDFIIEENAILTDPTNGVATITLTPTITNVQVAQYYYDLKLLEASGRITLSGNQLFVVKQGVQS